MLAIAVFARACQLFLAVASFPLHVVPGLYRGRYVPDIIFLFTCVACRCYIMTSPLPLSPLRSSLSSLRSLLSALLFCFAPSYGFVLFYYVDIHRCMYMSPMHMRYPSRENRSGASREFPSGLRRRGNLTWTPPGRRRGDGRAGKATTSSFWMVRSKRQQGLRVASLIVKYKVHFDVLWQRKCTS